MGAFALAMLIIHWMMSIRWMDEMLHFLDYVLVVKIVVGLDYMFFLWQVQFRYLGRLDFLAVAVADFVTNSPMTKAEHQPKTKSKHHPKNT